MGERRAGAEPWDVGRVGALECYSRAVIGTWEFLLLLPLFPLESPLEGGVFPTERGVFPQPCMEMRTDTPGGLRSARSRCRRQPGLKARLAGRSAAECANSLTEKQRLK